MKSRVFILAALLCLGTVHAVAQDGFTFPHIVADQGQQSGFAFSSTITLFNLASTTCSLGFTLTEGPDSPLTIPLLIDGQQSLNSFTRQIPGNGLLALDIDAGGPGTFNGAVDVEILTPSCNGTVSGVGEFFVRTGDGIQDVYSYATPPRVQEGSCTNLSFNSSIRQNEFFQAGVAFSGFEGGQPFPGNASLQLDLFDSLGNPAAGMNMPFDGNKIARNLDEVFGSLPGPILDGLFVNGATLQVCPQNFAPVNSFSATAINVSGDAGGFQFGSVPQTKTGAGCRPDGNTLCLQDNRFRVQVEVNTALGEPRFQPDDTGLFFFFDPSNFEVLVKVLDGCDTSLNTFWVFAAATTNVEYTLTVTDTQTNLVKTFINPLGTPSAAITDTQAFATCP